MSLNGIFVFLIKKSRINIKKFEKKGKICIAKIDKFSEKYLCFEENSENK